VNDKFCLHEAFREEKVDTCAPDGVKVSAVITERLVSVASASSRIELWMPKEKSRLPGGWPTVAGWNRSSMVYLFLENMYADRNLERFRGVRE